MEKVEEKEKFDFLKAIYGDNIPEDLEMEVMPSGTIIYTDGKPNIKKLVAKALTLMS